MKKYKLVILTILLFITPFIHSCGTEYSTYSIGFFLPFFECHSPYSPGSGFGFTNINYFYPITVPILMNIILFAMIIIVILRFNLEKYLTLVKLKSLYYSLLITLIIFNFLYLSLLPFINNIFNGKYIFGLVYAFLIIWPPAFIKLLISSSYNTKLDTILNIIFPRLYFAFITYIIYEIDVHKKYIK
jgi:hypothetical protein